MEKNSDTPLKKKALNLISQLHSESILHSNDKATLPCSAVWLNCFSLYFFYHWIIDWIYGMLFVHVGKL